MKYFCTSSKYFCWSGCPSDAGGAQRGVAGRRDHHLDPAGGGAALLAAAARGLRAAGAPESHQKLYDGNCLIV